MPEIVLPAILLAGFALPLGFIAQVDGYVKYLRLEELVSVYAWGWGLSLVLGVGIGLLCSLAATLGAWACRGQRSLWRNHLLAWTSLCIAGLAFTLALQLWLKANDLSVAYWMARHKTLLALAIAAFATAWILRRQSFPQRIRGIAWAGMIAGALATSFSLVTGLVAYRLPTQTAGSLPPAGSAGNPQNVILVTVDTLAADHMSLHGYARATTPQLDRLGQQANVFDSFYSNSNSTVASMVSVLSGQRPWSHRLINQSARLEPSSAGLSLIAKLKAANYQTFAAVPQASPYYLPLESVLDRFGEIPPAHSAVGQLLIRLPYLARVSLEMGLLGRVFYLPDALWSVLHDKAGDTSEYHFEPILGVARQFISERDPGRPFFLWVHLLPPHAPYATPAPFLGQFDSGPHARTRFDSTPLPHFMAVADQGFPEHYMGRYDESIRYMDHHVGQFLDWLRSNQVFDGSIVIVTGDHGESFSKQFGTHGGPMLHEPVIRVPLIYKEAGQRIGRRIPDRAEQADLLPTILDGLRLPADRHLEGTALLSGHG